jgi:hypothetical protein
MMDRYRQEIAGLHGPMVGREGGGIRSGQQAALLIDQNKLITYWRLKLLRRSMSQFGQMMLQMMLHLPPPQGRILPQRDGTTVEVDTVALRETKFLVDSIMVRGSTTAMDERRQASEYVIGQYSKLIGPVPGGMEMIVDLLADIYEDKIPALRQFAGSVKQLLAQQRQQAANQPGNTGTTMPPAGGPPRQGQAPPPGARRVQ